MPNTAQCSSNYLACHLCRKLLRSENSSKSNKGGKDKKCLIFRNIFNAMSCRCPQVSQKWREQQPTMQTFQLPQANLGALKYAEADHPLEMMYHRVPSGDYGWYEESGRRRVPLCIGKGLLNKLVYTCIMILFNGHTRKTKKKKEANKEDKMKERRKIGFYDSKILYKFKERGSKICQHWHLPQDEKLPIEREQAAYSSGSSKSFQLVTKAFYFCTPPNLLHPPPATHPCLLPCSPSGIHQIPLWDVSVSYCNGKSNWQGKKGLSAGFANGSSSPKSSMHGRAGAYCMLRVGARGE